MTGKTSTGFEFTIRDDLQDDYELLELLVDIEGNELKAVPALLKKVLDTDKQYEALKKHVKKLYGYISSEKLMAEMTEILNSRPETKNS